MACSSAPCLAENDVKSPEKKRQKMPQGNATSVKCRWHRANEKLLIKLMHEEFVNGTFSPFVWGKICTKLNGLLPPHYTYNVEQLKGKYYRIRRAWRLFNCLLTKETGYVWNNKVDTVNAPPDHIAQWIADHPNDRSIIRRGLPHYDLCTVMFARKGVMGPMARYLPQQPLPSNKESRVDGNIDAAFQQHELLYDSPGTPGTPGTPSTSSNDDSDGFENLLFLTLLIDIL
ncbi:hypothetical protein Salat_2808000 [Sesamum alatum]|uniref:Myb/SANT-like domain-containing protein n=1 Tax=Sesamum alatum TaxID=300844 RepID=A0AAE1XM69_9LAMI|nr:hypothetical protein Salat_2808000 [Sesamum alatum]